MDDTTSWVAQHFRDRMTQKEIDEALVLAMEADKREIERLRAIVDGVSAVNLLRLQAEIERLRTELAKQQSPTESAAPDGWQMVPAEPTPEMVQAGWEEHEGSVEGVYLAMLAAAPKPEGGLAIPTDDTALRAALTQREQETIERCATVVENVESYGAGMLFREDIAAAVRALEVKP